MYLKVFRITTDEILFPEALVARTFLQRFTGLMFKKAIEKDKALVFYCANSIHTFFMRFSIDVIFLDKNMRVIKICNAVRPWRIIFCRKAFCAIECLEGQTSQKAIKKGQALAIA